MADFILEHDVIARGVLPALARRASAPEAIPSRNRRLLRCTRNDVIDLTLTQIRKTQIQSFDDGLESHVGNTPLLPLRRVTLGLPRSVQVFAKAEWFNPGGSVKDRPALNIIRTAIANGDLTSGKRLLNSTSGNMGISYTIFGAALGIPVTLCLPANASPERITIFRVLGAK